MVSQMVYKALASVGAGLTGAYVAYHQIANTACHYIQGMPSRCTDDVRMIGLPICTFLVAAGLTYLGLSGKLNNILPD